MDGTGVSGSSPRLHHASHRSLLVAPSTVAPWSTAHVDAVVVPTARPSDHLRSALSVAAALRCPIVAICDGRASPGTAVDLAAGYPGLRCYAVHGGSALATRYLPGAVHQVHQGSRKQTNISAGRNVGLLVGRLAGWRRVLFLDDDVRAVDVDLVRTVARRVHDRGLTATGWVSHWYPDNSVVCHANRLAGNAQASFISTAALVAEVTDSTPVFPPVYNEDWFFLFDLLRAGRVGHAGTVLQVEYDPYLDPQRAADEEFGDLVAEGLYHLLHEVRTGRLDEDALAGRMRSTDLWADELGFRTTFVERIGRRLTHGAAPDGTDPRLVDKALASLAMAADRLSRTTATDVVAFIDAWREDQDTWRRTLRRLHPLGSVQAAFDRLHLDYETTWDERTA
ncbi:MAG: hypothetical protein ACKVZ6_21875 [Kineosporiaceae bacterium]